MSFTLRRKLKSRYSAISKSTAEKDISPWIKDNFYLIDKHYRLASKDKNAFKCKKLYSIIEEYCENRDYSLTEKSLKLKLSAHKGEFSYKELCCIKTLLAISAIIKIGEFLENGAQIIPNAVKLLISLSDPIYDDILPAVWQPEELLSELNEYVISDNDTKSRYRKLLSDYAEKFSLNETDAAKKLIRQAKIENCPLGNLLFTPQKGFAALWMISAVIIFLCLFAIAGFSFGFYAFLLAIPFSVTASIVSDWIISFFADAYFAPRIKLDSVPENAKTLVAVASLVTGRDSDSEVFESLIKFRYMNPDENVYFCLLADLPDAETAEKENDIQIFLSVKSKIDELNRLHGNRFCLFFRKRTLNKSENRFGGWERKRGAVSELISHIVNGNNPAYYGGEFIKDIKYLLTLDSDTNLSVCSVNEMLSVALHPVNTPVIKNKRVVRGYGIIQPTVRTALASAYQTGFSRLISGAGGTDIYTNAEFRRSQALFGSGSFCGKGLINVYLFDKLVNRAIPEGLVLSHDIIEGSILKTLSASEITLTDSTPSNTVSFFKRQHRWMRGDFQNLYFLKGGLLDFTSKWRVLITVLRHSSPVFSLIAILSGAFFIESNGLLLFLLAYSELFLPFILSIMRFLLSGSPFACIRFFSKAYSMLVQTSMRLFFELSSACRRALLTANAFILAGTRLITRKKTLEWVTAAQTEKLSSSLGKYVLDGWASALIGLFILAFAKSPFIKLAGLLFFVYPLVSTVLARSVDGGNESKPALSGKQKRRLSEHVADMFAFYNDNVGEETHYLPPDNIQFSPVFSKAMRTSPTNIGFYLVSLLAARDMEIITSQELCLRLDKSLSTIESLNKYKGNLYNWYSLTDLSVISDNYVSTVDSGNFIVMLTALKEGVREYSHEEPRLNEIAIRIEKLIDDSDLTCLYDERKELFKIGINAEKGTPDEGCYDLLMSEARMTAYYAVAASVVSKKHWQSLGRTLTHHRGYIGMMSWSGTAFEYLMPQIFLPLYRDSFLYESIAFSLMVQKSENPIWGVSESGYYSFDSDMNYQYKANGLQKLALRRISPNEKIISPYSSYLALCVSGSGVIKNLNALENRGMYGKYGFYEAYDLNGGNGGICVKSYMAHHIGMSIIACLNALKDNIFVRRFMSDRRMGSATELLQEKIPIDSHIFEKSIARSQKEIRPVYSGKNSVAQTDINSPKAALLTRGDISAVVASNGQVGLYSGDRLVSHTQYMKDSLRFTLGVTFSRNNKVFGCAPLYGGERSFGFEYNEQSASHITSDKEFSGLVRYSIAKNCNCFIITTRAEAFRQYDIDLSFEPVLESKKKYLSHISFSRLFIESEYDSAKRILYFHRRSGQNGRHIFTVAVAPRDKDTDFSFISSKEPFSASSIFSPLDYAFAETDNKTGACIDPLCLARAKNAEGGKAVFLISCGETKGECERNIKTARAEKSEYPSCRMQNRLFCKILPSVLYNMPINKRENFGSCGIGDLWSRGISGDYPIVVSEISEAAFSRTNELLKSFIALKGIPIGFEAVIIVSDSDSYHREVEGSVREICESLGISQNIGRNGGIFILRKNELSQEFIQALKSNAHFYIDFSNDASEGFINPEYEFKEIISLPQNPIPIASGKNTLASGNGYFAADSYVVDKTSMPKAPYSFVLSGYRFGTVITQSSLGYTFFDNARERKLCSFFGDSRSLDNGERIFMVQNGKKYDLCAVSSKVCYKKGSAVYSGDIENCRFIVTVTVPPKYPVKLIRVQYIKGGAKNTSFEISPVMGDSPLPICGIESVRFESGKNKGFLFRNTFGMTFPEGRGFAGVCDGTADAERCAASGFGEDLLFFLGACMTENGAKTVFSRVNKAFFEIAEAESAEFAASHIPKIKVATRSETHNAMVNFFLPYQTAICRFYARGSFYQSGGAYGFRDQLQDCLALIYSSPKTVRTHIIRCCAHQYTEGCVMHWWHTRHFGGVNRGIKSKCSDDLLYLPFVVADYLKKTGDKSLLDVEIRYLSSPPLGNISERYEQPSLSEVCESVYLHCLRALGYAEKIGKHGLLLMGSCDWNDAFSLVGEKGKGESIFSTLLFIVSAESFLPIIEERGDSEAAAHYREATKRLRENLEKNAFFKDRYARAFCDDGTVLGVEGCEECEIDILSQAFAAFAKLNSNRTKKALTTAFSKLYDQKNKIFKLFSPPFTNGKASVGYIRGYAAGIRENGGQYSHGALWGALGCLKAGMTEEALLILDCVNPAARCADKELSKKYKTEPYAVAADIYSGAHSGRGGWSWYTGAAAWYYRIMIEQVLGLNIGANNTVISANPVIPFEAEITLGETALKITASQEIGSASLDGTVIDFPIKLSGGEHRLELPVV